MVWKKRHKTVIFLLVIGIGVFLRVYDLGHESIWLDEAVSVYIAQGNIFSIISQAKWDPHPPLYYTILHFWIGVFGTSEFTVRLLSTLFGILAIPMIYKLGNLLFGVECGLYSASLLTLSKFHVTFSQEARMYSLLTLLALISLFFFLKTLKNYQRRFLVCYAVSSILMIYTHYFGFFILFFQNIFFIIFWSRHKNKVKKHVVVQIIIFLLFIPWLLRFFAITSYVLEGASTIAWIPRPNIASILGTFFVFSNDSIIYLILFISLPLMQNLYSKTKNGNLKAFTKKSRSRQTSFLLKISSNLSFCVLWLTLPILLTYIISFLISPIYLTKYLIIVSPSYYILTIHWLKEIKIKKIQTLLVWFIIIISINALATSYYNTVKKEQWKDVVKYLTENAEQDDLILIHASYMTVPFGYYFKGTNKVIGINEIDELREVVDFQIHVWLIISHKTDVNRELLIKKEMDNTYVLEREIEYVGINLSYYVLNKF